MSHFSQCVTATVLMTLLLAAIPALAENEGQEDLDKASELNLSTRTLTDLAEVIRLSESALEKGLDEGNRQFAENLLASALIQRGMAVAKVIFTSSPPDARWPQFRHVALRDLDKAVELVPNQAEPFLTITRLNLLPGGDRERAAEAIDRAIELLDDEPKQLAKALLLRAGLRKDEPEKRLADLNEAVRILPDDAAVLRTRALFLTDTGKHKEALEDLNKAIKLEPEHGPTYEAKGLLLARMKKFHQALVTLDRAHKLNPKSVLPLLQKARVHVAQKKPLAAVDDLNQARELEPSNPTVLLLRAGVYQEMGKKEKALADVDEALVIRPGLPAAMRFRAMLLANTGNMDDAIAELEKLHELQPKDTLSQLQLAMFYMAEKKLDEARAAYSNVLDMAPDNVVALRGRGDALLNLGKHAEAVADYEKVLKLLDDDAGLLNNLAWVLATSPDEKLRDGRRAIELATKACELTDYKQAHIVSTLAAAYAEIGDFAAAVKWSEKGLEIGDDSTREPLQKELESYRAEKPWRELLGEEEEEEEPEPKEEEK